MKLRLSKGMLRETLKMAIDSVRGHKFRSFLTVLGIVIGVMTAICIASLPVPNSPPPINLDRRASCCARRGFGVYGWPFQFACSRAISERNAGSFGFAANSC